MIAVMAVIVAIAFALAEGVLSVLRDTPRRAPLLQQPSLVLVPVDERRAQRLRFVGAERRRVCEATAEPASRKTA